MSWLNALGTGKKAFHDTLREVAAEVPGLKLPEEVLQRAQTLPPEDILEKERIPEDVAARAYAKFRGLKYESLSGVEPDPRALQKISDAVIRTYGILPIAIDEKGVLQIAVPYINSQIKDAISQQVRERVQYLIAPSSAIQRIIESVIIRRQKAEQIALAQQQIAQGSVTEADEENNDVWEFLKGLVKEATLERASDIHIEPQREGGLTIRFRVDGQLRVKETIQKEAGASIITGIKNAANLNIAERRLPQDGRLVLKEQGVTLRLSTGPTIHGEMLVMRLLPREKDILSLEQLGFSERNLTLYADVIRKPTGIVLVTGPTGSGKSTTLAATVSRVATSARKVLSVEDPVEYPIPGVIQHQVNEEAGYTFARALRAFLRQDPDVIYVGEIRDSETAHIATQAALTGHLVFGTLHTNDAASSVTRLLQMGIEPFNLAPSLRGVLAQRLVRRICPRCSTEMEPGSSDHRLLLELAKQYRFDGSHIQPKTPVGCEYCHKTGYYGRIAIHELMVVTPEIEAAIAERRSAQEIAQMARKSGMITLFEDGLEKVLQGHTTLAEVTGAAGDGEIE
jgi:type IV pilus assembly protein PilB